MKTKYGAAVAPVFVLAGAYVGWSYINRRLWKKKDDNSGRDSQNSTGKSVAERRRDNNVKNIGKEASSERRGRDQKTFSRSVSMGAIRGGKLALQRLLDLHSYRVDTSSLVNAEIEFESLLSKETPDFGLLQVVHICIVFFSSSSSFSGKKSQFVRILFLVPLAERHCEDGNEWKRSKRSGDIEESIGESKRRRERS